ncbi:pseudouridine synthase [Bizionia argentinensis JUB59]|uniref:Pseudouridine synthase n=1 Tax=Bizionia argentinensis JUB59 TaxID=1046627 RepID=G2E9N1_9FLAO|nr:pseudouridine synthase [Bizionia argentinensis]EGV44934.1 pseudouridine synthase [Bizionia argentinensis JUB59]
MTKQPIFHFKLFKPYGFISQFIINGKQKRNKRLLGELFNFPENTMAIGRLDENSEGLLLLTTDGKTSTYVTGGKIEKEYYVQVDGTITAEAITTLQTGVSITVNAKPYLTKPGKAYVLDATPDFPERGKKIRDARHGPTTWISITIKEGKYRQVRKMTSAVGFPTLRLVRVRVGTIILGDLEMGHVEPLETIQ